MNNFELEKLFFNTNIGHIYNSKLSDDLSKFIFINRVLYSLTNDYNYIKRMVIKLIDNDPYFEDIMSLINLTEKYKRVVLYNNNENNNNSLRHILFFLNRMIKVSGIIDISLPNNYKAPSYIKIVSKDNLNNFDSKTLVVFTSPCKNELIVNQLQGFGFKKEDIFIPNKQYPRFIDKPYFHTDLFKPTKNEIFIDGGTYDGTGIKDFVNWTKNDYSAIYAFEPCLSNYKVSYNYLKEANFKNSFLSPKALYSSNGYIKFNEWEIPAGSRIDMNGTVEVPTITLDSLLPNTPVTFIKLDVEGAELEALKGARSTIQKYKPKLAICVYHKPQDIIEIINLIIDINNEYKFFIRHHSLRHVDTVLYAL